MLVLVDSELGKEQEDSLVVVCGDSGCELAVTGYWLWLSEVDRMPLIYPGLL